jgi:N-acetylmuramic acid 6-phosphate (MurNAc-6-P) etherase
MQRDVPQQGMPKKQTTNDIAKRDSDFDHAIDERSPELKTDLEAAPEQIPEDVRESEALTAGQAGDSQDLSPIEEASEESVEELAASGQALEAASVEGSEDAADHPERPVHTHQEYGRPDDLPPRNTPSSEDEAA